METVLSRLKLISNRVLDNVLRVLVYGGGVVLVLWTFVFVGTVAARAFFHATPVYLEEYTEYFVVFVTASGLAYALRKGTHIRVTVVVDLFSQKVRNMVEIFVAFISLVSICTLTAYSARLVLFAISEEVRYLGCTRSLLWPVYLCIPVGYGLLSLALVFYFCHSVSKARKG